MKLCLIRNTQASGLSAPINTSLPLISGTTSIGSTLSCSEGGWSNYPDSFSYQWYENDVEIDGATSNTYVTTSGIVGDDITCGVVATNSGGSSAETMSSNTITLTAANEEPILVQPGVIAIDNSSNNGVINFTPTVTQGTGLTFSSPSGVYPGNLTADDINTTTGQLTGAVGSSYDSGTYVLRATNEAGLFYDIDVRWHQFVSTGSLTNTDAIQVLGTAGRKYTATEVLSAPGTLFAVTAQHILLDLGGFAGNYDQATAISIPDHDFETVDAWNFDSAPNASQFTGASLDNTLFDGTKSLKFLCPEADNEHIVSNETVTLEPNTTYIVGIHASFGTNTSAKDYDANPGVGMYIELVGTGAEGTIRAVMTTACTRGIQFIYTEFTTGAGTPTYNVRIGVENGSLSSGPDVYFDRAVICRSRAMGVVMGPTNWDSGTPEDVTSYGNANGFTITNGSIVCGSDASHMGHSFFTVSSSNLAIVDVTATINGPNASCYWIQDSVPQIQYLIGSTFTSTNRVSSNRDNGYGAVLLGIAGTVSHCAITDGPISGIKTHNQSTNSVRYNTVSLRSSYTNCFGIVLDGTGSVAYGNTINNAEAPYESRGIGLGTNVTIWDNIVISRDGATNQEYSGLQIAGAHLMQSEVHTGGSVTNESHTLLSAGSCYRLGPDNSNVSSGVLVYNQCTGIVNVLSVDSPGTQGYTPACIKTINCNLSLSRFDDPILTTNACLVFAGGGGSGELLIVRPTITYVNDSLANAYPWIIGYPSTQNFACRLRDPSYADAGSRAWVKQVLRDALFGTTLTGTVLITEDNTCIITLTDGVNPLASTAVVVTDEQSNEVFNDSTDVNGQITFIAENWRITTSGVSNYQTHTFTVTGYNPATADLTDTNKTPTIALTEIQ